MMTDADKAEWILKNGNVKPAWIFERVDDKIFKRPIAPDNKELPPWMSKERVLIKDKDGNYDKN